LKLWRDASKEANVYKEDHLTPKCDAGLHSEFYWGDVFDRFKQKWRHFHRVPEGPELEPRCKALLDLIRESRFLLAIRLGTYTDNQLEQIGEFFALVVVCGLEVALLFDAERSALVYEYIPAEWLSAANLDRPKFQQWYLEKTGKVVKPKI
jgi:hypothetical protein